MDDGELRTVEAAFMLSFKRAGQYMVHEIAGIISSMCPGAIVNSNSSILKDKWK